MTLANNIGLLEKTVLEQQNKLDILLDDHDNININDFLEYRDTLEELQIFRANISKILEKTQNIIDKHKKNQEFYTNLFRKCIAKDKETPKWSTVIDNERRNNTKAHNAIQITKNISIPARRIAREPNMTDIDSSLANAGNLFYREDTQEFIFKTPIITLRGNIGKIFSDDTDLNNTKICTYQEHCINRNTCKFWHNPQETASSDVMNFTNRSWIYDPKKPNRRKIGSIDTLEEDLANITKDDYIYFMRQTMHDLLCSIVINQYINKK